MNDVDISMCVDNLQEASLIEQKLPKLFDNYVILANSGGSRGEFMAFVGSHGGISFIGLCPKFEEQFLMFYGDRDDFVHNTKKLVDVPIIKASASGLSLRLDNDYFKLCFNYVSSKNLPGEKANF